jgi:hypothetical protein
MARLDKSGIAGNFTSRTGPAGTTSRVRRALSTPTRFRQMLDDSTAFVGVEPRNREPCYRFLFPICSQLRDSAKHRAGAASPKMQRRPDRGHTVGTRFATLSVRAPKRNIENQGLLVRMGWEDVRIECYYDNRGLFEENHFAIPADRIQIRRSRGATPLKRTPTPARITTAQTRRIALSFRRKIAIPDASQGRP